MIEIQAPATLMEGYKLDTEVNGRILSVTIPPGGVEKGQKFMVPMTPTAMGGTSQQGGIQKGHVPVGHWKDGLCDCFQHGLCQYVSL